MPTTAPAASAASTRRILNVCDAADYTGRSVNYVRRVLRYEVPVIQHGTRGKLYFEERDLDVWLAMHKQPASW